MSIDYNALLEQVLSTPEFSKYSKISDNPPKYRDYTEDENPKYQLSRWGLYDYSEGRLTKNLLQVAKEVGVDVNGGGGNSGGNGKAGKKVKKKSVNDGNSPSKKGEIKSLTSSSSLNLDYQLKRIDARTEDKDRWEEKHWPFVKRYFVDQRNIPESLIDSEFYRTKLQVTARRYTPKDKDPVYELIVPIWSSPKKSGENSKELLQLHKIQIDPKTGEKLGKKIQGRLGEVCTRGIWLPAERRIKGEDVGRMVMVVEGLEDALTIRAVLKDQAQRAAEKSGRKLEDGRVLWDILVTCGTGYMAHAGEWLREYCGEEQEKGGYKKRIAILDNDGPISAGGGKGASARASVALGDGGFVERFLPVREKQDANRVLCDQGLDAVWEWLKETQGNSLSLETIKEEQAAIIQGEDLECLLDVRGFHFEHNPLSDIAVGSLFLHKFKRIVRVTVDGQWFVYDAKRGRWDSERAAYKVRAFVSSLYSPYRREFDRRKSSGSLTDGQIRSWLEFLTSLGSSHRQSSVIKTLVGAEAITCRREDFDTNPELLNVLNGVVDMGRGVLLEHTPELMCSRQAPVVWKEKGEKGWDCPVFDKFLEQICCGDKHLLSYKLCQLGYCVSGQVRERAFFFHLGVGCNGKSVEGDLLLRLLGSYAQTVSANLFTDSGGYTNEEMYELAKLPGVRVAICGETTDKRAWSEAALKRYTGGSDEITARPIRQAPFTFRPVFKLIIHGNNKPKIGTGDQALWTRMHLIPYNFVAESPDVYLGDKLLAESSGILRRLVEGYIEWKAEGSLRPPDCVLEAREDYRSEVFADLSRWLNDCCIVDLETRDKFDCLIETSVSDLYENYEQWAYQHRRRARHVSPFGRWLTEQGIEKRKSDGCMIRVGIRLKTEDEKTASEFDTLSDTSPDSDEDYDGLM